MLEKSEGAINNGQPRDTCNIGHKTQNEDKKNTTQKTIKMSYADQIQMYFLLITFNITGKLR